MKVLGLFSGIGMLEYGFHEAGFEVVASNELHPTICKTLRKNFTHDIIETSVHNISIEDLRAKYGQINGIIGGFPCTVYSTAADIHKTRVIGKSLRIPSIEKISNYSRYAELGGELFLHYFRIVANLQPDFFVIENVPGLLGARIVLETFKNTPYGKNNLGYYYGIHEGLLNTVDFGLPQNRPRFFFVGYRKSGDLKIKKPEQRRKLIIGDVLEDNPDIELPEYARRRLEGITCRDRPIITEAGENSIAPTCVAHYAKDRGTRLIKVGGSVRPYTTLEYARLQGIPDSFSIEGSDYLKYLQIGNSVSLPVSNAIAEGIKEILN